MPRRLLQFRRRPPWPSRAAGIGAFSRLRSSLALALSLALSAVPAARAASELLETVKQNPARARQMCARFKQLNAEGQSAMSQQSIAAVAAAQGLSPTDAEILITYVIGMNCPDVR
jgi:hypothetical protein